MALLGVFFCALLAFCACFPFFITKHYGAGWGVLMAIVSLVLWCTLGPRPMPGLLSGAICIGGILAIAVSLVAQVIALFRG